MNILNSFLQGILWTVQGGLNARLKFHELKTGQSDNMLSFHEKLINGLIEENQKVCINVLIYIVLFVYFH